MTSKSRSFDGIINDSNSGITDEQAAAIVTNTNTITALSSSIDTLIPTLIREDNSEQTKLGGFIANYLGVTNVNYSLTKDVDDNFVFTIPTGEKYIFKIGTDQIIELSNTGFNTANTNISYKISGTDIQNKFLDKTSGGVVNGNTSFTSNFSLYGSNNVVLNATSDIEKWTMAFGAIVAGTNVEYCNSKGCVFNNGTQNIVLNGTTTLNNSLELANTIPLSFGNYSFRPQQYSLNKTLTIAATPDTSTFTNMAFNCRSDIWNNVNTGASNVSLYNAALEGYYKCTISQTATSSAGNFIFCDIMFDYILHLSVQSSPDIIITEPTYNYRKKPTNQARPTIEIDHLNNPVQSQPVFVLYSGQNSGETMPIQVRLTKMDY